MDCYYARLLVFVEFLRTAVCSAGSAGIGMGIFPVLFAEHGLKSLIFGLKFIDNPLLEQRIALIIPDLIGRSLPSLALRLQLLHFLPQHLNFLIHHNILLGKRIVINFQPHGLDVGLQLLYAVFTLF